jgi:hypothetical protein
MPNFLVHDGTTIVNAIVADSLEVAQSVTGLTAFPAEDGGPWIGWTFSGDAWIAPPVEEPSPEPVTVTLEEPSPVFSIVTPEQEAALIDAGWTPPAEDPSTPEAQ